MRERGQKTSPLQDSGTDGSGADGDGSAEHVLDGRGTCNDDVGRAGRGHDGHGPDASAGRGRRGGLNGDLLNRGRGISVCAGCWTQGTSDLQ